MNRLDPEQVTVHRASAVSPFREARALSILTAAEAVAGGVSRVSFADVVVHLRQECEAAWDDLAAIERAVEDAIALGVLDADADPDVAGGVALRLLFAREALAAA